MTNKRRLFELEFRGTVVIELADEVIDAVDDDFRMELYPLYTAVQIAEHVGYNMAFNGWPLSALDGWANQPDSNARLLGGISIDYMDTVEIDKDE